MMPLLVRDLALEQWAAMDRYAEALHKHLPQSVVADGWRLDGPRYLTRYWAYPRALRGQHGDLVHILDHSYAHCLRAFPGVPSVITLHDLYPLRVLAESKRTPKGMIRDTFLRWVLGWLGRATRIIVSTQFTAREAERFLDVDAGTIRVIPYGVDQHFFTPPAPETIQKRRQGWYARRGGSTPTTILLNVGSCAPRKNVEAAIGALGILRRGGVDAILIQIGGHFAHSHRSAIHRAGVGQHVIQEPAVTEDDLVSAYHAADVLVMPSTFEGFGLPAVEAQAAGLPVVTTGAGGLREAVGEAGVITGAASAESMAEAVGKLLADDKWRQALGAVGKVRAAELTWPKAAALTQAVYDELKR
jgi:glycosyltransferase involved in cell wall biosynthesis